MKTDRHTYWDPLAEMADDGSLGEKELELLRQAAWQALRCTLLGAPDAREKLRLLISVLGQLIDFTDDPVTLVDVAKFLKDRQRAGTA
jgi:hypothetical protein